MLKVNALENIVTLIEMYTQKAKSELLKLKITRSTETLAFLVDAQLNLFKKDLMVSGF